MKEIAQQKFSVYTQGIDILLPPNAEMSSQGDSLYAQESERLFQITHDGTLHKRYPDADAGIHFMEDVCYERRDTLLCLAVEASSLIVKEWEEINPNKPIAVILFGSVAKGLVKNTSNPDPSNIDLAVIGDITNVEKERLFDQIRDYRMSIQEEITSECRKINSKERNPGNLGVSIQCIESLKRGDNAGMRQYIGSGSFPLHDPDNIWSTLEAETLQELYEKRMKKNKNLYVKSREWENSRKKLRAIQRKYGKIEKLSQSGVIYTQKSLL